MTPPSRASDTIVGPLLQEPSDRLEHNCRPYTKHQNVRCISEFLLMETSWSFEGYVFYKRREQNLGQKKSNQASEHCQNHSPYWPFWSP